MYSFLIDGSRILPLCLLNFPILFISSSLSNKRNKPGEGPEIFNLIFFPKPSKLA